MQMKYIIVDDGYVIHPIVFSELIAHDEMARRVGNKEVLGAGFAYLDQDKFGCYGKSISLGVASRGDEDAKFLNKWLLGYDE